MSTEFAEAGGKACEKRSTHTSLERFFYYLEDLGPGAFGIAVFDELEKVQSHLLVGQMDSYFKRTSQGPSNGREESYRNRFSYIAT